MPSNHACKFAGRRAIEAFMYGTNGESLNTTLCNATSSSMQDREPPMNLSTIHIKSSKEAVDSIKAQQPVKQTEDIIEEETDT